MKQRAMLKILRSWLDRVKSSPEVSDLILRKGEALYLNGQLQLLTRMKHQFDFSVDDAYDDFELSLFFEEDHLVAKCSCKATDLCHHAFSGALQVQELLEQIDVNEQSVGKKYTRRGMIKRVLEERRQKARHSKYHLEFTDNIYGEHLLHNEKGQTYYLTLRDRKNEEGYCSCQDYRSNKLGTCKHLIFAYQQLNEGKRRMRKASKQYPFVEIFLDPLQKYRISWYYPHKLPAKIKNLIDEYFGTVGYIHKKQVASFLGFVEKSKAYKQILIREEVLQKIEKSHNEIMLERVRQKTTIDFSLVSAKLYPYQQKGVEFATFKDAVIIADEMGLGKTLQAITTALAKKQIFGFQKTLVVCPASVKDQWKKEIEKFTTESVAIIEGLPEERAKQYMDSSTFFTIINYELVMRDYHDINKGDFDFIILDEAQRIKNFSTITAQVIKRLQKKHALVITGTPIENQLSDIYSIMQFISPSLLSPLWEFSYQHCYFDERQKNKIVGYYNLQNLKKVLRPILIRREKRQVLKELPNVTEHNIFVEMSADQAAYHSNFARGIAKIITKKYISPYDMQRLMLLLSRMRMVCDSTYLIDQETNISPKLVELKHILVDQLDLTNSNKKVIIFSEWVRMNGLIGKLLRKHNIGYTELNGKVPVKKRKHLIDTFYNNPECKVFLSTEAGGTGLNLQVADTLINFELPWNPAKKNQRIGRIDRLGQQHKNLMVINFITKDSIETRIASGLMLKQNLFDGVLNKDNTIDMVDFSSKGRSQFLKQLESMIGDFQSVPSQVADEELEATAALSDETDANLAEEEATEIFTEPSTSPEGSATQQTTASTASASPASQNQQMQQVLSQGMGFLSSLMKMATGEELGMDEKSIQIDEETGEVVMRFKLPKT